MPRTSCPARRAARAASHSGSWYTNVPGELADQISTWMDAARGEHPSSPDTKAIIAPHAGYAYSGRTMAYAYTSLPDPDTISTIFILGPSHHFYSDKCHISQCSEVSTPLGPLAVDTEVAKALLADPGLFARLDIEDDEAEHSVEMHLPYVKAYVSSSPSVTIVPIVVGALSPDRERAVGEVLAPYLRDRRTVFIVSSDFCHWGRRFGFQFHDAARFERIHESIAWLDHEGMKVIEKKRPTGFVDYLIAYSNTICGRHPIGVLLCALEAAYDGDAYAVAFTRYDRSGLVEDMGDSSVSYASAVVKLVDV